MIRWYYLNDRGTSVPQAKRMDIQRDKPTDYNKRLLIGAGAVGLFAVIVALLRLQPAAPTVEASTWPTG